jgi:phosphoribosylanthranilate isomerase
MERRVLVKVCGMREGENIQAIARCGVDYLGCIFVQGTPRFVTPELSAALPSLVPAHVKTVAVFRNAEHDEIENTVHSHRFSAIQLHGLEDSGYIAECKRRLPQCKIFKAASLSENLSFGKKLPTGADFFIFDSTNPGSGEEFDWEQIKLYRGETPFFLAGGIGPQNIRRVRKVIEQYPLCVGVDLNSKVEVQPGLKSESAVRAVVEGIRI